MAVEGGGAMAASVRCNLRLVTGTGQWHSPGTLLWESDVRQVNIGGTCRLEKGLRKCRGLTSVAVGRDRRSEFEASDWH